MILPALFRSPNCSIFRSSGAATHEPHVLPMATIIVTPGLEGTASQADVGSAASQIVKPDGARTTSISCYWGKLNDIANLEEK